VDRDPAFGDKPRHDDMIARRHSQLGPVAGALLIVALDSLAGTLVDSLGRPRATASRLFREAGP
jgi:hypothetical protein